jgi:hypothetical protein
MKRFPKPPSYSLSLDLFDYLEPFYHFSEEMERVEETTSRDSLSSTLEKIFKKFRIIFLNTFS